VCARELLTDTFHLLFRTCVFRTERDAMAFWTSRLFVQFYVSFIWLLEDLKTIVSWQCNRVYGKHGLKCVNWHTTLFVVLVCRIIDRGNSDSNLLLGKIFELWTLGKIVHLALLRFLRPCECTECTRTCL